MTRKIKTLPRTVRFEREMWEQLENLSTKLDLSIAHLIRVAVKEYLKYRVEKQ